MPIAANPSALAKIQAKTPVLSGPDFGSAAWSEVPVELRESAWFSAKVSELRFLQATKDGVERATAMLRRDSGAFQSRQRFIVEMQKLARDLGLTPTDPRLIGTVQDVTSEKRLGLIWDIQKRMAQGFARHKMGLDPDVLNAFPGYEFKRVAARKMKRLNWPQRFLAAGGRIIGGRMVALKTDPCWVALSVFGTPWEPFDWGSGMGIVNLSRAECTRLGLIKPGERLDPPKQEASFTQNLQAPVKDLDQELQDELESAFGAQVVIKDGVARWQGNVIGDLYENAIANAEPVGEVRLGLATQKAIALAADIESDLAGYELTMLAPEVRHIIARHGVRDLIRLGSGETAKDQIAITLADLRAVPFVWRDPDVISAGKRLGDLIFTKLLDGNLLATTWERSQKRKLMLLKTLSKKKVPGA